MEMNELRHNEPEGTMEASESLLPVSGFAKGRIQRTTPKRPQHIDKYNLN
jgi:hypothetical protein